MSVFPLLLFFFFNLEHLCMFHAWDDESKIRVCNRDSKQLKAEGFQADFRIFLCTRPKPLHLTAAPWSHSLRS